MSRIGKKPIHLPTEVDAVIAADAVTITGPKGQLVVPLPPSTTVTRVNEPRSLEVTVARPTEPKQSALWGLARQLIANAVLGVHTPYTVVLEFVGVGFKVSMSAPSKLLIEVGFSHPVEFVLPTGIEGKIEKQTLTITGIDKQLVGEIAAQIRRIRPPEPYKGKGIKYAHETIRRKAGKAATKGA